MEKKNPLSIKIGKMHGFLDCITCPLIVQNWSEAWGTKQIIYFSSLPWSYSETPMKEYMSETPSSLIGPFLKQQNILQEGFSFPSQLSFSGCVSFLNSALSTLLPTDKSKCSDCCLEAQRVGNFPKGKLLYTLAIQLCATIALWNLQACLVYLCECHFQWAVGGGPEIFHL